MKYLIALLLAWCVNAKAFDPGKELNGSTALRAGPCSEGSSAVCVLLMNNGKFYLAAIDQVGLLAVFQVKEPKEGYSTEEMKVVWKRRQPKKGERSVLAPQGSHPQDWG